MPNARWIARPLGVIAVLALVACASAPDLAPHSISFASQSSASTLPARSIVRLAAYGCDAHLQQADPVSPRTVDDGVEYRYPDLTEWYRPGARGLEQGFTVARAPCANAAIRLEIAVSAYEPRAAEQGVDLYDEHGTVRFHYTDLVARDALGASLPATMRVENARIALTVDARDAVFPIVVDPELWTQAGTALARSDGAAGDLFGISLGFSADTLIAGAAVETVSGHAGQGAAYVYVRTGSTFAQQALLTSADGAAGDNFGVATAIATDTAVVGAYTKKIGTQTEQGAAYVFVRSVAKWTAQGATLSASDGKASDHFGTAVAISADTIVLGAPSKTVGTNSGQGAAYVFVRSAGAWTQQAELVASDGAASDRFGTAVGVSGDTAVIGASYKKRGQNAKQGVAYVFTRSGTKWTQSAVLAASDGTANDQFGDAVAIDTDTVAVGAYNKNVGVNSVQGVAYVFLRSGTTWARQGGVLRPADAIANNGFGAAVSLFGNTLVVGSPAKSPSASLSNQGAGYVFLRSGTTWAQQGNALLPSDAATQDQVGYAVAGAGDFVALGAPTKVVNGHEAQGATYVFARPCTTVSDCTASATCTNGVCSPKQAQGQSCTTTTDCAAGTCVDGVCCESACSGQCQACAEKGSEGKCLTISGTPRASRAACTGVGSACAGSCDGVTANQCSYPSASVSCGQSCANGNQTKGSCNGAGTCSNQTASCGAYVCGASACKTSCASDADCSGGTHCVASACQIVIGGGGGTSSGGSHSGGAANGGTANGGTANGGVSAGGDTSSGGASAGTSTIPAGGVTESGAAGMSTDGDAGQPSTASGGVRGEAGHADAEAGADSGEAGARATSTNTDGGGCGCRVGPRAPLSPSALALLLPLALAALRRQRRRPESAP